MIQYNDSSQYNNDKNYLGGSVYSESLTEVLTATEDFEKNPTRILSETISLTETRTNSITRIFTENLGVSEVFSKVTAFYRSLLEGIGTTETYKRYHNGFLDIWSKIGKGSASYSEVPKITTVYSNTNKTDSAIWSPVSPVTTSYTGFLYSPIYNKPIAYDTDLTYNGEAIWKAIQKP
jgi:hypothetical protein